MKKVKLLIKRILSLFPTELPTGVTSFNKFADEIIELVGNLADADSIRFTLAGMIMHMPPQRNTAPKHYFVKSLRKTAANQVAHHILTEIKIKHDEQAKANKLKEEQERQAALENDEKAKEAMQAAYHQS